MEVRRAREEDFPAMEQFLFLHQNLCFFVYKHLRRTGVKFEYKPFHAEYWIAVDSCGTCIGVLGHYTNGGVHTAMFVPEAEQPLVQRFSLECSRTVKGVFGPEGQCRVVFKTLGLDARVVSYKAVHGAYVLDSVRGIDWVLQPEETCVSSSRVPFDLLLEWFKHFQVEVHKLTDGKKIEERALHQAQAASESDTDVVLLRDGRPVSFCGLEILWDGCVFVGPVYTAPEARRQGFARRLLNYVVRGNAEASKAAKKFILFAHDPDAIQLYESLGFRKEGDYSMSRFLDN